MSLKSKLKLHECTSLKLVLYGNENWRRNKINMERCKFLYCKAMWRLFGMPMTRVKNEETHIE